MCSSDLFPSHDRGVGRFLYDLDVKYLDVEVNGDFKEYYYDGETLG